MAGAEKKGLFGKLFKRKDQAEESVTPQPAAEEEAKRATATEPSPSQEAPPKRDEAGDPGGQETSDESSSRLEATKTDIVELEMDIPEEEISTVALSLDDLKGIRDSDDEAREAPRLSLDEEGEEIQLETAEINGTTEIKLEDSGLKAAVGQKISIAPSPSTESTPPAEGEDDRATEPLTPTDVNADLPTQEEDPVPEIELDLDDDSEPPVEDEPPSEEDSASHESVEEPPPPEPEETPAHEESAAEEPPSSTGEQAVDLEVEEDVPMDFSEISGESPRDEMSDDEALSVTSSDIAGTYGFPEYVSPDEAGVEQPIPESRPPAGMDTLNEVSAVRVPMEGTAARGVADTPLPRSRPGEDGLGFRKHAAALARFVMNSRTPMRIAIQGGCGTGKSSFMRLIEAELDKSVCLTSWFSPWHYARFGEADEVPPALIRRILNHLEGSVTSDDTAAMRQMVDRVVSDMNTVWRVGSVFDARSIATVEIDEMDDAVSANGENDPVVSLREKLSEIVHAGLERTTRERLVIFIDDMNRLEPSLAMELLDTIEVFLSHDHCVFVIACNAETIEQGVKGKNEIVSGARECFERVFQLSFDLPHDVPSMKDFVRAQLESLRFDRSDTAIEDYLSLIRHSVGFNPRRIKRLVNRLALTQALSPEVCATGDGGTAPQSRNQKLLFALGCLESEFGPVFQLLSVRRHDERELMRLIDEHLRGVGGIEELDSRYEIFSGTPKGEAPIDTLIAFIDVFSDIFYEGDATRRLEREDFSLLGKLIDLMSVTGARPVETPQENPREIALTEFCVRVKNRLAETLTGVAPDGADTHIRGGGSRGPWFGLWYNDRVTKQLWAPGRLSYELSFDRDNRHAVSVRLRCNTARLSELGVSKEAMDRLTRVPLLEEHDFRVKDYQSGRLEIVKVLHECSCTHIDEIRHEDVESVAEELQELVQATHDLFDVRVKTKPTRGAKTEAAKRNVPPCKVCGSPLEEVTTKDGSTGFKCATCRKIYKPKKSSKSGS